MKGGRKGGAGTARGGGRGAAGGRSGGRAGGRGGARQPLSRVRPGAAKKARGARAEGGRASAAGSGERARKSARAGGGGPPRKTRSRSSPSAAPPKSRASHPYAPASPDRHPERVPADPETVYSRLHATFPDAHCALHHQNAYQLLVATILSAQCTDVRVNLVTPALFDRFPDPPSLAEADRGELESLIKSTGFFRNKAKSLTGMALAVVEKHDGAIPSGMEALTELPGVGRKTANVILGNAFGKNEGVVVDTHVARISYRLGLTSSTDPVKIEQDLMRQFPREEWTLLSHLFIEHGRQICQARSPRCENCPLADICPSSLV